MCPAFECDSFVDILYEMKHLKPECVIYIYIFVFAVSLSLLSFDLESFMMSLAAVHEIEEINRANFLPGVRLGYLMCDTCSYASKALQSVGHMLAVNGSLNMKCDYTDFRPRVKIILGALYSEVSIAVARLLNVYMVPLVSHTFCLISTHTTTDMSFVDLYSHY